MPLAEPRMQHSAGPGTAVEWPSAAVEACVVHWEYWLVWDFEISIIAKTKRNGERENYFGVRQIASHIAFLHTFFEKVLVYSLGNNISLFSIIQAHSGVNNCPQILPQSCIVIKTLVFTSQLNFPQIDLFVRRGCCCCLCMREKESLAKGELLRAE
jgi:hypothetical protein